MGAPEAPATQVTVWHAAIACFQTSSHLAFSWVHMSLFSVCTSLTGCNRKLLRCLSCFLCSLLWFCLDAFQLRYWSRSEREDIASVQRTIGNQTSSVILGLKGSTTYYISVRAYNTAGTGPPSTTVNVTTKKPRKYPLKVELLFPAQRFLWGH